MVLGIGDPPASSTRARPLVLVIALVLVLSTLSFLGLAQAAPRTLRGKPSQPSPSPAPWVKPKLIGPGWLHTEGTRIVDERGMEVRFAGVGLQTLQGLGLNGNAFDVPDQHHFDNIAAFGFNMVRLPIRWLFIEPAAPTVNPDGTVTRHWNRKYLQTMDAVIHELGERGIKVVLSMNAVPGTGGEVDNHKPVDHIWAMPPWLYPHHYPRLQEARCTFMANLTQPGVPLPSIQDGLVDVWRMVAARYAADSTVVGADILNEPYLPKQLDCDSPGENLLATLTKLGSAIQAANPRLLLVVEDAGSPTQENIAIPSLPPLANVVYSFHLYARQYKQGEGKYQRFLEQARVWNVPLYMGEFNAFGGSTPHPARNWRNDTTALLAAIERDRVSWSGWAYCCGANSLFVPRSPHLKPDLLPIFQEGFD